MNLIKSILLFSATFFILSSCKKEYNCVCTNPGGSEIVFSVKDSKEKAKAKCADYYNEHFASIPWNETSCEIK
jgi:hypothetical protein